MKNRQQYIILFLFCLLLSACTQNHGYIGRLFGSWYLYEMTCDGATVDIAQHGDTFWSFQSELIMVSTEYDMYTQQKTYGTWNETDDKLILNFSYTYDAGGSVSAYDPPAWLGFPKADNIVLLYLEKNKKSMSFRYTDADGKVYEYFLRKTF